MFGGLQENGGGSRLGRLFGVLESDLASGLAVSLSLSLSTFLLAYSLYLSRDSLEFGSGTRQSGGGGWVVEDCVFWTRGSKSVP